MNWFDTSNLTASGPFITLTLDVYDNAVIGTSLPIRIEFAAMDGTNVVFAPPINAAGRELAIERVNGAVQVGARRLGSVSGGMQVTFFDAILVARHLVGHADLETLPGVTAFDITAGKVTPGSVERGHVRIFDAVMIARYVAGHDVVLGQYPTPQS
jgi:hypothetical protein